MSSHRLLLILLLLLFARWEAVGGQNGPQAKVLSRDSNWIILAVPNQPDVEYLSVTYHLKKADSNISSQRDISSGAAGVLKFRKTKDSISSSSSSSSSSLVDVYLETGDTGSRLTWADGGAMPAARIKDQLEPPQPPLGVVQLKPPQPPLGVVQITRSPSRAAQLVFFDDFSSLKLDGTKWSHDITAAGGKFAMFTPEPTNSFVRNGILHIKPTLTVDSLGKNFVSEGTLDFANVWGRCTQRFDSGCKRSWKENNIPPVMSARLYSRVAISHGRVEVVARLPRGDWLWPGMWLSPDRQNSKYGAWPQSGEIDIMESRGNTNLTDAMGYHHGAQLLFSTIHYGPSGHRVKRKGYKKSKPGHLWSDDYHTFSLDWTADHLRTEVDGERLFAWSTPKEGYFAHENFTGPNIWSSGGPDAPFDGKFHLVLDVAVGDPRDYFDDAWVNHPYPKPWRNGDPHAALDFWNKREQWLSSWHEDDTAFRIKSVKIYQY